MTTLERLELLKQDLMSVEASQRAHMQINRVLQAHIDAVKNESKKHKK